jgi:hypothetical protein
VIQVRVGPRTLRRLHPGLHVDVRIGWGAPLPLLIRGAVLRRGPDLEV